MANTWSIIIEASLSVPGKVAFRPDLPDAKQGDTLNVNEGDLINWNNRTDDAHQPAATNLKDKYLTNEIPAGKPSSPAYKIPTYEIKYKCENDANDKVGKIKVKAS